MWAHSKAESSPSFWAYKLDNSFNLLIHASFERETILVSHNLHHLSSVQLLRNYYARIALIGGFRMSQNKCLWSKVTN